MIWLAVSSVNYRKKKQKQKRLNWQETQSSVILFQHKLEGREKNPDESLESEKYLILSKGEVRHMRAESCQLEPFQLYKDR